VPGVAGQAPSVRQALVSRTRRAGRGGMKDM
jgi:hypothetical protein